jgi:predicted small integral membrane protein
VLGLALGTLPVALLLIPGGTDTPRAFWDATFGYQLSRPSPFSLWHWGIYPGLPDLRLVQAALEVIFALGAIACLWVPRRLDAVRLAALSGALVIGFQLCLSYWFYTYIPWFFPFTMIALCAPSRVR